MKVRGDHSWRESPQQRIVKGRQVASVPFSRAHARCSSGLLAGAAKLGFGGFGKNVDNMCILGP